ncbi:MAG: pilus assembly protein TadG-related protein [Terracidiphilus sp.]
MLSRTLRCIQDERGQSTALLAMFGGLCCLGFVAIGLDVGYLFHEKRMAQSAADAAAIAAAEEAQAGDSGNEQSAANAMAKLNGFDPTLATNPAVVTLSTPSSGNFAGSSYVQVVVSKPIPTFFGAFAKMATVEVSAQAIAGGGQQSPTCICLEDPTGMDLNMSNDSKIQATTCGITDDSTSSNAAGIVGSADLNALTLGIASSTWTASANVNNGGSLSSTKVITNVQTTCSPTMPAAPTYNSSQCTADPLSSYGNGGSSYSVGPGSGNGTTQTGNVICYNALTLGANGDKVNVNPGTYIITGGELHFESGANNASNTGGNGVFFYLVNGASLVIDNGANVNLTAQSSGTYSGILVYQPSSDTATLNVQGGSNTTFNGAIFAPGAVVDLANGTGTTITAEIVAQSLTMAGGGTLISTPIANLGTLNLSVAKLTQ